MNRHTVDILFTPSVVLQMALADREQLLQQNYQLQHKLADYFRKKKNDERQDYDKNVTDQEQRYLKYMGKTQDESLWGVWQHLPLIAL